MTTQCRAASHITARWFEFEPASTILTRQANRGLEHDGTSHRQESPLQSNAAMSREAIARPLLRETIRRALRLRCPNCGRGLLFRRWFAMRPECTICWLSYFREEGYYLGAMFLNFIFSALLIIFIYCVLLLLRFSTLTDVSTTRQVLAWIGFGTFLCLGLVRHSYSLWLGLDFWISPWLPTPPSDK